MRVLIFFRIEIVSLARQLLLWKRRIDLKHRNRMKTKMWAGVVSHPRNSTCRIEARLQNDMVCRDGEGKSSVTRCICRRSMPWQALVFSGTRWKKSKFFRLPWCNPEKSETMMTCLLLQVACSLSKYAQVSHLKYARLGMLFWGKCCTVSPAQQQQLVASKPYNIRERVSCRI